MYDGILYTYQFTIKNQPNVSKYTMHAWYWRFFTGKKSEFHSSQADISHTIPELRGSSTIPGQEGFSLFGMVF